MIQLRLYGGISLSHSLLLRAYTGKEKRENETQASVSSYAKRPVKYLRKRDRNLSLEKASSSIGRKWSAAI